MKVTVAVFSELCEHVRRQAVTWSIRHALAFLMAAGGVLNVLESVLNKEQDVIDWMQQWLPFEVSEGSRLLLLGAGLTQLSLSRGVWRGKRVAWLMACSIFSASAVLHLGRAFDWHHTLSCCVALFFFWRYRREFVARSDRPSLRVAAMLAVPAFVGIFIFGWMSLQTYRTEVSGDQSLGGTAQTVLELMILQSTDTQLPLTARAATVFSDVSLGAVLAWFVVLGLALRPVLMREKALPTDREAALEIIRQHGRDPMCAFADLEDKLFHFYQGEAGKSVVAYAMWRGVAVALADPVGPAAQMAEAVRSFVAFCRRQDWSPVFYETSEANRELYKSLGLESFKIAEDARVKLADFTLQGGKFQNLRTGINKAKKSGMQFEWIEPGKVNHGTEAELHWISEEWLAEKGGVEMTFDLGSYSSEQIQRTGAALVRDASGKALSFATWLPYGAGKGRTLDLMRSRKGVSGVMDFLIAESLKKLQEAGVEEVCLGSAPLANAADSSVDLRLEERAVKYLFENFNSIYGYRSLFEYKKKYQPEWKGRYLVYPGLPALPAVVIALVRVHYPSGLMRMLRS